MDGANYVDFDPKYDGTPITYFVKTYDFSSIPGLDDNANAAFRILFDGATSVTGNNRIDNLQINGFATVIPEAGTGALLALPLFALGVVALRRRK